MPGEFIVIAGNEIGAELRRELFPRRDQALRVHVRAVEKIAGNEDDIASAQDAINGADLPAVSRDAAALVAKLSSAALELRRVLAGVDTGDLNASLANVQAATDELIVLIHNLEERPSSVLFSKSPNPVRELAQPPRK